MPNPWMPGLRHDPGLNAGYRAGRNRMRMVVDHWTAGRNSYSICKDRGLCQILLPKIGAPWQFAEIDAKCWHAGSAQYGDYNGDGPGLEVERMNGDEPLTPDQTLWLGRMNAWMASEWRVPNVHYWGPRFPWHGADFHGHVNHAQIHPNEDGVSPAEWDAVTGGAVPVPPPEPETMGEDMVWIADTRNRFALLTSSQFIEGLPVHNYETSKLDKIDHLDPQAFDNIRDDLRARVPIVGRGD